MRNILAKIDRGADRVGYWYELPARLVGWWTLMNGAFTAVAKHLQVFGPIGWAEAILIGTAAACLIVLVLSFGALAYRRVWPKPEQVGTASSAREAETASTKDDCMSFDPAGLYVGQILVYANQVDTKGAITIRVCAFNSTHCGLRLQSVTGCIVMEEQIEGLAMWNLPPPRAELKQVDIARHGSKFVISLEQQIPLGLTEKITSVKDERVIHLNLERLSIRMINVEQEASLHLPLWDSLELSRGVKLRAGRKRTRFN